MAGVWWLAALQLLSKLSLAFTVRWAWAVSPFPYYVELTCSDMEILFSSNLGNVAIISSNSLLLALKQQTSWWANLQVVNGPGWQQESSHLRPTSGRKWTQARVEPPAGSPILKTTWLQPGETLGRGPRDHIQIPDPQKPGGQNICCFKDWVCAKLWCNRKLMQSQKKENFQNYFNTMASKRHLKWDLFPLLVFIIH